MALVSSSSQRVAILAATRRLLRSLPIERPGEDLPARVMAEAERARLVGAAHAGACLGALMCGILLVPVFGTSAAAYLLAGIKLASVAFLAAGKRASLLVNCQVELAPGD